MINNIVDVFCGSTVVTFRNFVNVIADTNLPMLQHAEAFFTQVQLEFDELCVSIQISKEWF